MFAGSHCRTARGRCLPIGTALRHELPLAGTGRRESVRESVRTRKMMSIAVEPYIKVQPERVSTSTSSATCAQAEQRAKAPASAPCPRRGARARMDREDLLKGYAILFARLPVKPNRENLSGAFSDKELRVVSLSACSSNAQCCTVHSHHLPSEN